jgi:hypothetical protein
VSLEVTLVSLLKQLCPNVSPDVAKLKTPLPLVTYLHVGGTPLRYVDGTAADKRHALVQVNVWHNTRAECLGLARQIEDLLAGTTLFDATPEGEVQGQSEPDLRLYGLSQDFSIHAAR